MECKNQDCYKAIAHTLRVARNDPVTWLRATLEILEVLKANHHYEMKRLVFVELNSLVQELSLERQTEVVVKTFREAMSDTCQELLQKMETLSVDEIHDSYEASHRRSANLMKMALSITEDKKYNKNKALKPKKDRQAKRIGDNDDTK